MIESGTDDLIARTLADGQRLTRDQGFVENRVPLADDTVDRDLFARAHDEDVADLDPPGIDVAFHPFAHHGGRGGLQLHQCLQSGRGLASGPGLQELAQPDERDDGCASLEVDVWSRSKAEDHRQTGEEGHRRAKHDQHVHVGAARAQAPESSLIELPAHHELHDGRRHEHGEQIVGETDQTEIPRHAESDERHRQDETQRQEPFLRPDLRVPRSGFRILGPPGCIQRCGIEPLLTDQALQLCDADHPGDVVECYALGAPTHVDCQHSVLACQERQEVGGSRVAPQSSEAKLRSGGGHAVTQLLDSRDDADRVDQPGSTLHGERLTGQIDPG